MGAGFNFFKDLGRKTCAKAAATKGWIDLDMRQDHPVALPDIADERVRWGHVPDKTLRPFFVNKAGVVKTRAG